MFKGTMEYIYGQWQNATTGNSDQPGTCSVACRVVKPYMGNTWRLSSFYLSIVLLNEFHYFFLWTTVKGIIFPEKYILYINVFTSSYGFILELFQPYFKKKLLHQKNRKFTKKTFQICWKCRQHACQLSHIRFNFNATLFLPAIWEYM